MSINRAIWDPSKTSFLLDLCIAEKEKFNWEKQKLTNDGWRNVYNNFTEAYGPIFTKRQMSNKLQTLKTRYNAWKVLQNSSGLGRNKTTGAVEADPDWFGSEDGSQDGCEPEDATEDAQPRRAPPPYFEQLDILFGSRQDRGTFLWAGGLSESNTLATQEPVGPSAKRGSMDNEVNSPPKKKTCSMEDYMRQISESIVNRSSREQSETREQADVAKCMEMLIEDGVDEGTELFFKALDLFRSSVCRTEYKKMKDPANRVAWIEWTWTNGKQK